MSRLAAHQTSTEDGAQSAKVGLTLLFGFAAGAGALFLFGAIAEDVMSQETTQLDDSVLAWLRQFASPTLDTIAMIVSLFGSELVAVFLVALLVVLALKRYWVSMVGLLVTTLGAQILNDILKDIFHRTRPAPVVGFIPAQDFSFPSGHAMVSAAFYFFVAYLAWRLVSGVWRWVMVAGLIALVLLIGLARLYLSAHYLSDVLAGYFVGFLWTDAVILSAHFLRVPRARPNRDVQDATQAGDPALVENPENAHAA